MDVESILNEVRDLQRKGYKTIPRTDGRPHGIRELLKRKIRMLNFHVSLTEVIRTILNCPPSGGGTVLSCAFRKLACDTA